MMSHRSPLFILSDAASVADKIMIRADEYGDLRDSFIAEIIDALQQHQEERRQVGKQDD